MHALKGGDPAAPSDTATLLRLHPSHEPCRGNRPLAVRLTTSGKTHSHGVTGRCVQDPGTYSPRHADPRLLAIPASRSRVADYDPDYDAFSGISSTSRLGNPLYAPLYDV